MLAGELYDALNRELVQQRDQAHDLCQILNATREADRELRRGLFLKIFGKGGDTVWLQPPFCDFGSNIEPGERVYFNFNCTVLDVCKVIIGDYSQFGSGVKILTPLHPLDAALRRKQEYGAPVTIGSDVWVGSGSSSRVSRSDRVQSWVLGA
jgi:maltose O-acetyltransferase